MCALEPEKRTVMPSTGSGTHPSLCHRRRAYDWAPETSFQSSSIDPSGVRYPVGALGTAGGPLGVGVGVAVGAATGLAVAVGVGVEVAVPSGAGVGDGELAVTSPRVLSELSMVE